MAITTPPPDTTEPADEREPAGGAGTEDELVAGDEVLLEEISIDGMCGVY